MRRRSPSYSPRRGHGERNSLSSPRARHTSERRMPSKLFVRNLPKNCKVEDLRAPFERFGAIKDIYLPRDYYTGNPKGFGFVQYLDSAAAEDAHYHMNNQTIQGNEITVTFAVENRKTPSEMRSRERIRDHRSRDNHRGRSFSRSPRAENHSRSNRSGKRRDLSSSYSRSPVRDSHHRSRSYTPEPRHERRRRRPRSPSK